MVLSCPFNVFSITYHEVFFIDFQSTKPSILPDPVAIDLALSWQEHSSPNTTYSTCLLVFQDSIHFRIVYGKSEKQEALLLSSKSPLRGGGRSLDDGYRKETNIYSDRNGTFGTLDPFINTSRFDSLLPCF